MCIWRGVRPRIAGHQEAETGASTARCSSRQIGLPGKVLILYLYVAFATGLLMMLTKTML